MLSNERLPKKPSGTTRLGSIASRFLVTLAKRSTNAVICWVMPTCAKSRSRHCAIRKVGLRALVSLRMAPPKISSGSVAVPMRPNRLSSGATLMRARAGASTAKSRASGNLARWRTSMRLRMSRDRRDSENARSAASTSPTCCHAACMNSSWLRRTTSAPQPAASR